MSRNVFHISPAYAQLIFTTPKAAVAALELMFEDVSRAVSSFEIKETPELWRVELLFEDALPEEEVKRRLALAEEVAGFPLALPEAAVLESRNWAAEVQLSFPPMQVAQFYVYGSHVETPPPPGVVALRVDAGQAFGSGEHATTSGCLLALSALAKKRKFRRILDMGTGSGILAMAAAHLWKCPVLAVDIDAVSVEVAADNMRINQVNHYVDARMGDGYKAAFVTQNGPYDLILSNILARPLMKFAPALARQLAPGGVAVLSGLLASQETMVMSAHRAAGLRLHARILRDGWATLVIKK